MVRNIEFREVANDFQEKLKEDINEICSSKNLFVFVDKSTNLCEISDTDYNMLLPKRLLGSSITSNYRKCKNGVKHRIDKESKKIGKSLNLSKKMGCCASRPAFITIKDRKPNFRNNTKLRLINPAKIKLRLVSKKHLEKITTVIDWFKSLPQKKRQVMFCKVWHSWI